MNERFDDIIRKQLDGLESPVPADMFDNIRNQPDVSDRMFDAGLKSKLQSVESPIAAGLFDKITAEADLANAPFDNTIKQKLTSYQSEVPADMWECIMQGKHRRKPVAWWWIAAGFILLLSGSTWYMVHPSNSKKSADAGSEVTDKTNVLRENPALPGDVSVIKKTVSPGIPDTSQAAVAAVPNPATKEEAITKNLPSRSTNLLRPEAKRNTRSATFKQQEPVSILIKDARNKKETGYQVEESYPKEGLPENKTEIMLNGSGNENAAPTEETVSTIHTLRLAISQQLRNAAKLFPGQLLKARPRIPVIPCPVNEDEGRNNWYADIYTSTYMFQKNISDKAGGKNAKNGFDSTLHRQMSYNAGINLVKSIGNNLLLKTGVQYNRLNESFRLTRINERKLVTTISVRIVIIAPGDTVYIRDTSVTEHIGTIQRRKQNTHQQWDVPVIIGYEFSGENIRLNANAGIIANIRSTYSGEMLADTGQQIIDAKNYNGKPVYKTNVGISVYAGLSIIKPLGQRTSLLIEPYARIGLQNTTTENAWFRQKNSSAGISVGLRYQLNGNGQRR